MAHADTTEPAAAALAQMRREALWTIDLINVFYTGLGKSYDDGLATQRDTIAAYIRSASRTDALHPKGWNPTHEIALWHAQMRVAFGVAAGRVPPRPPPDARACEIARAARRALLDSVLIPYDARFGQYKDPNQIMGFGAKGRLAFAAWLEVSDVAPGRRDEVLAVFDGILGILEQCRRELYRINGTDSRLNWMPMQFALEAEDHDDQEELDRLIERVVDRPFTDGNAAVFMLGQQFQVELANQIASARSYQVLWIHDYRGMTANMMPDSIGAFQTGNYLRALLRGVERYDSLGRMPAFFIFNDQNYYIAGKSQLWMDLLQDPLRHRLSCPRPTRECNGGSWRCRTACAPRSRRRRGCRNWRGRRGRASSRSWSGSTSASPSRPTSAIASNTYACYVHLTRSALLVPDLLRTAAQSAAYSTIGFTMPPPRNAEPVVTNACVAYTTRLATSSIVRVHSHRRLPVTRVLVGLDHASDEVDEQP